MFLKSYSAILSHSLQHLYVSLLFGIFIISPVRAANPFQDAATQGGIPDARAGRHTGLVNPNATPEARGLMRYLSAVYGSAVLSGHQMSYTWSTAEAELASIRNWTGEQPATRGFDLMDVINSWGAPHADNAIRWALEEGGIVHLCWHWRLGGGDFYSPAHGGNKEFPPGDPRTNATINADLRQLGDVLQRFEDARIPVLWRPLHEPPGNWFWWHTAGGQQYVALWRHMYNYLVNVRGLNNLIWVFSGADNSGYRDPNWYPGNEYVDIIGVDGYGAHWQRYWDGLWGLSNNGNRMAAMTENRHFPPWSTSHHWLFTCGWNNEIFNSLSQSDFRGHYNHPNTINFDDLPTARAPGAPRPRATWDQMLPNAIPPPPPPPKQPQDNQAFRQPVIASSSDLNAAINAVDGDSNSRWSSAYQDNQWIAIELPGSMLINRVVLNWEAAYATVYEIQISQNGNAWTTVHRTTNGQGAREEIQFNPVQAAHVRVLGVERATIWGISLYEIEVYRYLENTVGNILQNSPTIHFYPQIFPQVRLNGQIIRQ